MLKLQRLSSKIARYYFTVAVRTQITVGANVTVNELRRDKNVTLSDNITNAP